MLYTETINRAVRLYFYAERSGVVNDKIYNILKWIAMIVLPAIGTLYSALAGIWGFPYGDQIVGTILAVDTFLGAVLGISSSAYNKKIQSTGK